MNDLNWYWVYVPYLDLPEQQQESALKAGYNKVCFKYDVDAVITELRATKYTLWMARANRNKDLRTLGNFRKYVESHVKPIPSIYHYPTKGLSNNQLHKRMMFAFATWCEYLRIAEAKCLKKAEEYK